MEGVDAKGKGWQKVKGTSPWKQRGVATGIVYLQVEGKHRVRGEGSETRLCRLHNHCGEFS